METKKCNTCNLEKNISEFHKWKYGPDGYKRECKKCRKSETNKYYQNNSEKVKIRVSDYRKKNLGKLKQSKKLIYEKNKENILSANKKYRDENREKRNKYVRERKLTDPIFKLKHSMNSRIRVFMKTKNITKKNKTFDIVGCSPEELKEHLENQFTEGMTWENHGRYGWHIDHIIPLSSATTEDDIIKLCNYKNLQPLWAIDNIKKGGILPQVL
jgi:hypothetical protein